MLPPGDADLIGQFYGSDEWAEAKEKESFKRKRGLFKAIIAFLRRAYRVPEDETTPVELIMTANRMDTSMRSRWGKKGARTRAKRKAWKQKQAKKQRKKVLLAKIERAEQRRRTAKRLLKSPLLFRDLPMQVRPRGR